VTSRLALHAFSIDIPLEKSPLHVEAPVPPELEAVLASLRVR